MLATIDDVHHWHRQDARRSAADIAVQRLLGEIGRRLGHGQGNPQNGIGPKAAFVGRAIHFDHGPVDADLLGRVKADQFFGDLAVDRRNGLQHALAGIACLVAIAALDRLMRAGGGARRNGSAAHRAAVQMDIDLDGGVATAVQNFAGVNVDDCAHGGCLQRRRGMLSRALYPAAGALARVWSSGADASVPLFLAQLCDSAVSCAQSFACRQRQKVRKP